jgi:hypothetical protein
MKRNGKKDKGLPPESPGQSSVVLIPQPHGGALQKGNPGNKGGGRTPDVVKAIARHLFVKRLPRLASIADGKESMAIELATKAGSVTVNVKPNFGQQIKAMEVLGANAGLTDKDQDGLNLTVHIHGGGLGLIKIEEGKNGH